MESVEEICDHIGLINNGEVMVQGLLLDIRKHYMNGTYAFTTKRANFSGMDVLHRNFLHTGHTAIINSVTYPSTLIQNLAKENQLLGFEEVLPGVERYIH